MKPIAQLLLLVLALSLATAARARAQGFTSGSTGADGALVAPAPLTTTVDLPPDGVLNYTSVTVNNGATLSFNRNALNTPVFLLATGDVIINGVIDVSGACGNASSPGRGGPGGFDGGPGGAGPGSSGLGPGGGGGNAAYATVGYSSAPIYGNGLLVPLVGGSGGGGTPNGNGGCGGGGAILIASDTLVRVYGSKPAAPAW